MKSILMLLLIVSSVSFGVENRKESKGKWAMKDQAVDTFSMIPPRKDDDKFAPAAMMFDLYGKKKSIAVSLCGPVLIVEHGANVPDDTLGALSVERIDGMGWFGQVDQVVDGRVILRVATKGERDLLEKEIREFQDKHTCSYL